MDEVIEIEEVLEGKIDDRWGARYDQEKGGHYYGTDSDKNGKVLPENPLNEKDCTKDDKEDCSTRLYRKKYKWCGKQIETGKESNGKRGFLCKKERKDFMVRRYFISFAKFLFQSMLSFSHTPTKKAVSAKRIAWLTSSGV